jgi:2-polyprenyl-3-methyl-5-hydroxy-6-metoxy-1,4-benzoquinol methylase
MAVDYNSFWKKFANSRKGMKWEEIDYFIDNHISSPSFSVLDIWCWSWRLLEIFKDKGLKCDYYWVDLSKVLLEEAKKNHPEAIFKELNMLDIQEDIWKFDYIFLIASFHHLENESNRLKVLSKLKNILNKDWKIFMTNWALNSWKNYEKYKKSIINWSENSYWGIDYGIKFWEHIRYYHSFSLEELSHLFDYESYSIVENRLFDSEKNIISIIK